MPVPPVNWPKERASAVSTWNNSPSAPHRDRGARDPSVTYALIPQDSLATPRAASDAAAVAWHAFDALPPLAFDHEQIITMAHRRLVAKLDYSTIAFQFMPETFTLGELQCVYESLLNQKLDKRNFRKRILSLDLIAETGRSRRTGNHRPARNTGPNTRTPWRSSNDHACDQLHPVLPRVKVPQHRSGRR